MKNTSSSLLLALLTSLSAITSMASDLVTNVTIRQVRPWQGMVEVDYELTEDRSSDPGLSTSVTFMDKQHDKVYDAKTFTHPFTYTKGAKRMIWNAAKDNVAFKSSNVVCKVELKRELYCVIDLSGGTNATSYPVTTLSAVPEGGWADEYKTSKLVLRYVEPGTFTMGSPENEIGRNVGLLVDNEAQHTVTLTKGFYIGVFEVTQRQWELVMGNRPSYFNNDTYYASRPVERVSYDSIRGSSSGANWPSSNAVDADSFLGKIRAKTGLVFDLPTEAQWEYACRAGTTTALNSGKQLANLCEDVNMNEVGRYWYNGGQYSGTLQDPNSATATVGTYVPNAWGLYDMHGNVGELCLDLWTNNLGVLPVTDPVGATFNKFKSHLLRGGSLVYEAYHCRSAARASTSSDLVAAGTGFRLSCCAGSSK